MNIADFLLPGGDFPGGESGAARIESQLKKPEPLWSLRTGFRKGVTDQTLDDELFAGPDAAVLRGGFFGPWTGLLAEFREPYVLVEPDALAVLEKTKPLLIIPSGGLYGLADSLFFKAGLAQYARSGGVVLCFSQQTGADFSALPLPEGAKMEAAGWTQDSGPVFRSSTIQDVHPVLSSVKTSTPPLETDGYLISFPPEAKVLLSRPDGFPTLILYPFGRGWIVVTTLFSDFSYDQGSLDREEKALIRDLLSWAKSSGQVALVAPGGQFKADLRIRGPEPGDASSVRIMVMDPATDKPKYNQALPLSLKASQETTVPFTYQVPKDMQPGIYHIEYVLLDDKGRQTSPAAEAREGWFNIRQSVAPPPPIPRAQQPLGAFPLRLIAAPSLEFAGDRVKVNMEITRVSGPTGGQDLFVRVAGQDKYFKLGTDKTTITLDVPSRDAGKQIAYAIHHVSGRVITRGTVPAVAPLKQGIMLDRPWYLPGQRAKIIVTNMGSGELSIQGLGSAANEMIAGSGSAEIAVSAGLPAGVYPITWEFQKLEGGKQQGEVLAAVSGARTKFLGLALEKTVNRSAYAMNALVRMRSSQNMQGKVTLWLMGQDGNITPAAEKQVTLAQGDQEVPVSFTFTPGQGGIWQLLYRFTTALPEGAGFSREPVSLASGRKLFDTGDVSILGIATDRPIYYEAAGTVEVSGSLYSRGKSRIEIYLDDKRIKKEKFEAPGAASFSAPLPALGLGPHVLKAVSAGEKLESSREVRFIYGTRLPDLVVSLKTSDFAAALAVGVGVMNRGKTASGPSKAAVYEGDPAKGGTLIESLAIPPLAPGDQHVAIVDWPLSKKAGGRTFVAVADPESSVTESNKGNNTAVLALTVPDVLLSIIPQKKSLAPDERVSYTVGLTNLTTRTYKTLTLNIRITDPAGKAVLTETVSLPDFKPESDRKLDRVLDLPAPQGGVYLIAVEAVADKPVASGSLGITMMSALLLKGSLEGTPSRASLCKPFSLRYSVKNAGTIQPANGTVKIEIKSAGLGQLVYAQQQPFVLDARTVMIEKMEFPKGQYTVTLRATAVNQPQGAARDFLLAEQPLTVAGPVEVDKSGASLPRVLVWAGDDATVIEQAVAEKILKEAFNQDGVYYKIVSTAGDFTSQALSGLYNTYILFEINEMIGNIEWLKNSLSRGHGLVIIGAGDRTQATAAAFGFKIGPPRQGNGSLITFTADSGMGLSGTVPLSGTILPLQKKGATTAAVFGDKQPAVQIDTLEKGKIMVMPFSLAQSAINAGTTSLYTPLVRSAVVATAPDHDEPGDLAAMQLLVSSPGGPMDARLTETLPAGSKLLWTNIDAASKNNVVTFEITADTEPLKVLYLYQTGGKDARKPVTEVFYKCGEKFVSQGKVE